MPSTNMFVLMTVALVTSRYKYWNVVTGILRNSLEAEVLNILKSTYAESTKSSYKTHLKSYSAFCSVLGVPLVPADPQLISLYAVLLARSLQYKSIPQYLNIISLLHKSLDMPSPLDSFIVKSTLRGIKNTIGHEPTIKLPVTPEILYKILNNLKLNVISDACVWMACIIMFYGLLRKSNVVGPHKILRKDCKFTNESIQLIIRSSKTRNKHTDIPRTLSLPRFKDHSLCPVAAILNYLRLTTEIPLSAPLCALPKSGGKFSTLTYKSITDVLREAVPTDQASSYATHSFRRGGASYMFSIGMSVETIRLMGDWRSNAYQRYISIDSSLLSHNSVSIMQKNLTPPA